MYALKHPEYISQPWHVFITYIIATWMACLSVCFFNRAMPYLNQAGIFFLLAGFFITLITWYGTHNLDGKLD